MIEIERPKIICEEDENGAYAKFTVEPLEKGFGVTLGNALRRTLLAALPGAAVVAIRIEGVPHEFTTMKGVKEDVTEIVLNMKGLAVKTSETDLGFSKRPGCCYCWHDYSRWSSRNFKPRYVYLHTWRRCYIRYGYMYRSWQGICTCR